MNGSGEMTLAFELSALKELADPGAVFDDARRWSQYVGVVSDEPTYVVTNFTRKNRIRQDFFSGPKGKGESLASVREQFDTDRHVFVGTTDDDAALAADHEWEYLDVSEAAEAAEWRLAEGDEGDQQTREADQRDDWP
ncbi:hypothetical protein BRC82_07285 [Halobacteriales archaeon QS_1_67_19]|nr:MAG: hypothetical protein BRC82_07285 [Halobacteriales archaeon QS_1_67_19]